jgi:quercetin dioxygenase-like cupin family protein
MQVSRPEIVYEDERGRIIDVIAATDMNYATVITSKKGVFRGNHFHKKTVQWVYLLSGKVKSLSRMPGREIETAILEPGDLWKNDPFEEHELIALEDSQFLVLTSGLRGGRDYEKDTYRLRKPLHDQIDDA